MAGRGKTQLDRLTDGGFFGKASAEVKGLNVTLLLPRQ
jgi:hypothetical protein